MPPVLWEERTDAPFLEIYPLDLMFRPLKCNYQQLGFIQQSLKYLEAEGKASHHIACLLEEMVANATRFRMVGLHACFAGF